MSEAVLIRLRHGGISGSRVASGIPKRAHWPIPSVRTGIKCLKVQGHDIPAGHTPVQDVRGGGGTMVYRNRGNVSQEAEKTDPLPGLWSRAYCLVNDGAHMAYAWYGAIN